MREILNALPNPRSPLEPTGIAVSSIIIARFPAGLTVGLNTRPNQYAEAANYWRRYLASDYQSDWATRARRSLKFCEMQVNLIASA